MSNGRFNLLHLGINPIGEFDYEQVNRTLDDANDWIRYSPTNFLTWTNEPSSVWSHRLRQRALGNVSFILFTIDPQERQGWMPQELWDWLDKYSGPQPRMITGLRKISDKTQKYQPGTLGELMRPKNPYEPK